MSGRMQWLWDWIRRHDQQHAELQQTLEEVKRAAGRRDTALTSHRQALDRFDQELAAVQAELRMVLGHDEAQHERG
jgi:septal ring factor EnvC (AmiA/AmiB activator)